MKSKTNNLKRGFTLIELLACQPKPWRRQARSAFTLIELLVVIVIIGVLFAVAMPVFENAGRKDTNRAAFQMMSTMRLARQNAIAKRQWTLVIFPNRDGGAYVGKDVDKCLRSYAVIAVATNLNGEYIFSPSLRDPQISDVKNQLVFVSDWKYLPEGIYIDDNKNLTGNYLFNSTYYAGAFLFPLDPANPSNLVRPMSAVLFRPNGRAYVMVDGNSSGKGYFWQDTDYSRIYLTSAKYYEKSGGTLLDPTTIPGTNTAVMIRNKTGQVQIWDGSSY